MYIKKDLEHIHNDLQNMREEIGEQIDRSIHQEMITHIEGLHSQIHDLLRHVAHIEREHGDRLINMGLGIGSIVEVLNVSRGGPLLLAIKETRLMVGFNMARKIMVIPLFARRGPHRYRRGWSIGSLFNGRKR
ncbi:MAG: FeoA family protein [bacterium]